MSNNHKFPYEYTKDELIDYIKEINGLVGAVDWKAIPRIKLLIHYLNLYDWAYHRMYVLAEHSDRDFIMKEREKLSNELKNEISKINEELLE